MPKDIFEINGKWLMGEGAEAGIVISSRIRLARNIAGYLFPFLSSGSQSVEILDKVKNIFQSQDEEEKFLFLQVNDLEPLDRHVLVEKHLISPLLAKESHNSAVMVQEEEGVSIMVNEEDHLRMQCLVPALQLDKAWETINRYDDLLEKHIDYAFHEELGYLSSCPTNVGTGLRASVMVHLPGLVLTNKINRILAAVPQIGLVVRGFYGEGTEASGNLVQISNQVTLGPSEAEIMQNLYQVTCQIVEQERKVRQKLLDENKDYLADLSGRALGLLTSATLMSSDEAMHLLSNLRLGVDLQLIKDIPLRLLNELLIMTRPANLQKRAEKEQFDGTGEAMRAKFLREQLG